MAYTYGMGVQREVEYEGWLGRCKRIAKQLMQALKVLSTGCNELYAGTTAQPEG